MDYGEELYALTARFFHRSPETLRAETRFRRDLKADSLDFWEYVLLAEKKFDCFLEDAVLENVVTLGQFAFLLDEGRKRESEKSEGKNHGTEF